MAWKPKAIQTHKLIKIYKKIWINTQDTCRKCTRLYIFWFHVFRSILRASRLEKALYLSKKEKEKEKEKALLIIIHAYKFTVFKAL